jgi:hypothetical protein
MAENDNNPYVVQQPQADLVHEETMEDKKNQFKKDMTRLKLGWFGKILGGASNLPLNVAGAVVLILLLIGIGATIAVIWVGLHSCNQINTNTLKDIWSVLTPIITLTIGYLFGKRTEDN